MLRAQVLIDFDEVRIKVSQRKKFPAQLSMQNKHHCNQWNTIFLLIRHNRFAKRLLLDDIIVQKPIFTQLNNLFFNKLSMIHRVRNRGYMEETYRHHIFMIFIPDERS